MSDSVNQSTAITPPRLRPGDTVAVCAPAGPVQRDRLRAGLDRLAERYRVTLGEGAYAVRGYLAGDDARRTEELNRYLAAPEVRAIFVARGGYGIMRILEGLDAAALRRDPKPIVGFSDATALLAWAHRAAGVRGIHGPVIAQLGELHGEDVAWLWQCLEKPAPAGILPGALWPVGAPATGQREATLLGGNLTLIAQLVGTAYALDLNGAAVVIEDIGERPYAVDRSLTRLSLAGVLRQVRGALVGDFTACEERGAEGGQPDVWSVVDERLRAFGCPGLRGLPVGHGSRNLALPFAGRCTLDFDRRELHLLEAAVS